MSKRRVDLVANISFLSSPEPALSVLGEQPAACFFNDDALAQVKLKRLPGSDAKGSCLALMVWGEEFWPKAEGRPETFAPAFALPLQWRRTSSPGDDPCLPRGFDDCATQVRQAVALTTQGSLENWSLFLGPQLEYFDLSPLHVQADSAFAPLATALQIAIFGGKVRPEIFATGIWSRDGGFTKVSGLKHKLDAVYALLKTGTGQDAQIFVPAENLKEAKDFVKTRESAKKLQIRAYPASKNKLKSCLKEHLALLEAPPPLSAALEVRLAYANRLDLDEQRTAYYRDFLLADLATQLIEPFQKEVGPVSRGVLVVSVGKTPQPSELLVAAFNPQRLLLVHSDATKDVALEVKKNQGDGRDVEFFQFSESDLGATIENIASFIHASPEKMPVWIDITGGTKLMTYVLIAGKARGAGYVYVQHDFKDRKPVFGSERLLLLPKMEPTAD